MRQQLWKWIDGKNLSGWLASIVVTCALIGLCVVADLFWGGPSWSEVKEARVARYRQRISTISNSLSAPLPEKAVENLALAINAKYDDEGERTGEALVRGMLRYGSAESMVLNVADDLSRDDRQIWYIGVNNWKSGDDAGLRQLAFAVFPEGILGNSKFEARMRKNAPLTKGVVPPGGPSVK